MSQSPTATRAHEAFGPSAVAKDVDVLDSSIHYVESGAGDPVVFLHGSPTSSFLWRHVIANLDGAGRLLAPDLIGLGGSGKPDVEYSLADHDAYLAAWFDALDLTDVTLVVQDYGAAFGVSWARRNPDRVKALVLFEPVLRDIDSAALPAGFLDFQSTVRTPGAGEKYVLEDNRFLTELLPGTFLTPPSEEDLQQYLAPFPTPESRKPLLYFPRNLPIDGVPASSVEYLEANVPWLRESDVPKLLLTFEPGFLLTPAILEWARTNVRNLEIRPAGAGIHFVQEDQPRAIADAVRGFLGDLD